MKLKKYIIALFLLFALLFAGYKYGLFCKYNAITAIADIKAGKINLLIFGMPLQYDFLEYRIAEEFGFQYKRVDDCTVTQLKINGIEAYNKKVKKYLSVKLGEDWETEFDNKTNHLIQIGEEVDGNYVILQPKAWETMFDGFSGYWEPAFEDIILAERILIDAVAKEHQGSINQNRLTSESVLNYKQQFVCYNDTTGKKFIWINGLYDNSNSEGWKDGLIIVKDGGDYYFNILIDMDKLEYEYFIVNEEA